MWVWVVTVSMVLKVGICALGIRSLEEVELREDETFGMLLPSHQVGWGADSIMVPLFLQPAKSHCTMEKSQ